MQKENYLGNVFSTKQMPKERVCIPGAVAFKSFQLPRLAQGRETDSPGWPQTLGGLWSHGQELGELHQPAELQKCRSAHFIRTACAEEHWKAGDLRGTFDLAGQQRGKQLSHPELASADTVWVQTLRVVLIKFKVTGCPGCLPHRDLPHSLLSSPLPPACP